MGTREERPGRPYHCRIVPEVPMDTRLRFLGWYLTEGNVHVCIRPKPKAEVYDLIEELLRARGYLVDRDLLMRAVSVPHRTVVSRDGFEEDRRRMLRDAFLEMLRTELDQASD